MMAVGAWTKRFEKILGRRMAYVEAGRGAPIVFLPGNPTSPYLWPDVVPHVAGCGRCIAPDLIGMGDSEELHDGGAGSYTFDEHWRYLDALLTRLEVKENVIVVGHDWGSALAFEWAVRNPRAVAGIVYMEGIVGPMDLGKWSARPRDEETSESRPSFTNCGGARRPTQASLWQVPLGGEPPDGAQITRAYAGWMSRSPLPKLFINSEPGAILTGGMREFCAAWPNQDEVTVRGIHFVQEDSADDIGLAITEWITDGVPQQLTADFAQQLGGALCHTIRSRGLTVDVETLSADVTVDCLGKLCPIPVIETSKAIRRMEVGQTLLLVADDPGSDPDIHAWCDETDNTLLRMDQEGKVFRFWIRH